MTIPKRRRPENRQRRRPLALRKPRTLKQKKEIRTPKNPVRVLFMCVGGIQMSVDAKEIFEGFLEHTGKRKFFSLDTAGASISNHTRRVNHSDIVIHFLGQIIPRHWPMGEELDVKLKAKNVINYFAEAKKIKNTIKDSKEPSKRSGIMFEKQLIPSLIMCEVRKKFELREN